MSLMKLNWKPGPRELRIFGAVVLVGFGSIGIAKTLWPWDWLFERDVTTGLAFLIPAVVVGGLGLTGTRLALPFYLAWIGIAFVIGSVMSRLLLSTFYFLVITPIGLLRRLLGADSLTLRRPPPGASMWRNLDGKRDASRYLRQF